MNCSISDAQWKFYEEKGYLPLGQVMNAEDLSALQNRINDIMLGRAESDYNQFLMQLDSQTGKYDDAGPQSNGFKGPTLAYRKIQNLEHDPLYRAFVERPLFQALCARVYGEDTPIACFRAMFMNKPACRGTLLPWHQDAWTYLDQQPQITVWTALDPATVANGCVQVVPGSHRLGRINHEHSSGFLTKQQAQEHCPEEKTVYLTLEPGEAVVLHNWTLHRSDVNQTDSSRRAFSVCYMDAGTVADNGETFTPLFRTENN